MASATYTAVLRLTILLQVNGLEESQGCLKVACMGEKGSKARFAHQVQQKGAMTHMLLRVWQRTLMEWDVKR